MSGLHTVVLRKGLEESGKESSRDASTGRASGQLPRPSPGRRAGLQPPAPDAWILSQGAGNAASSNTAWFPLAGLLGPM